MQFGTKWAAATALAWGCALAAAWPARAAFVVNVQQVGSDVVMTGSGTIITIGLTPLGSAFDVAAVNPSMGSLVSGPTALSPVTKFSGISSLSSFGSGVSMTASSGSGDAVGIFGTAGFLELPSGYVSGGSLSDTDTYSGQTLASLGLTVGSYTWTWGHALSGGPAGSFTINVIAPGSNNGASAPLPAAVWAGLIAALMLAAKQAAQHRYARATSSAQTPRPESPAPSAAPCRN